MKVHVVDVNGCFWAEADYIEDVNRIERWFATGDIRRESPGVAMTQAAMAATPGIE
jgi:hypothetical protein